MLTRPAASCILVHVLILREAQMARVSNLYTTNVRTDRSIGSKTFKVLTSLLIKSLVLTLCVLVFQQPTHAQTPVVSTPIVQGGGIR